MKKRRLNKRKIYEEPREIGGKMTQRKRRIKVKSNREKDAPKKHKKLMCTKEEK